eukprot:11202063-Lingulodinium_polyedra.AAC.1
MGDGPVNLMYADNWGAVIKACEARGFLVELSQPGVPQTYAKAERWLRVTLVVAGLPDCFWFFAAPCYAHLDKIVASEFGTTPWYLRHGKNFGGR